MRSCLLAFCIAASVPAKAQPSDDSLRTRSYGLSKVIKGQFSTFALDVYGRLLLAPATGGLYKLDLLLDAQSNYEGNKSLGPITKIDATNPLRSLVFHEQTQTISILDNQLAIKGYIDLKKANIWGNPFISMAYDGNIWLFDEVSNSLKKIDLDGNLLYESPDFRNNLKGFVPTGPIFDTGGFLYLYASKIGWQTFDHYAAPMNRYHAIDWQSPMANENLLSGFMGDTLLQMDSRQDSPRIVKTKIDLEGKSATKEIFFRASACYALRQDGIYIYQAK